MTTNKKQQIILTPEIYFPETNIPNIYPIYGMKCGVCNRNHIYNNKQSMKKHIDTQLHKDNLILYNNKNKKTYEEYEKEIKELKIEMEKLRIENIKLKDTVVNISSKNTALENMLNKNKVGCLLDYVLD